MTKSAISHQLSTLIYASLVRARKDGKHVFYSLDDNHIKLAHKTAMEHVVNGRFFRVH